MTVRRLFQKSSRSVYAGLTKVPLCLLRPMGLFTVVLSLLAWSPLFAQQDDTLDWLNSYQAALNEARRSHKPIFLEYRCEP